MTNERPVDLKEFYPSDLFGYAEGLTNGELTVLKAVREALEKHVNQLLTNTGKKHNFHLKLLLK